MKKWSILSGVVLSAVVVTGCSSAYRSSAGYGGDDLYVTHDRTEIARRQQQEAEARKAEAEARRAEWEARIAEAQAAAAENAYDATASSNALFVFGRIGRFVRKRLCPSSARVRIVVLPDAVELLRLPLRQCVHLCFGL